MARRQQTPRSALLEEMQRRQNLVELEMRLRSLHPADIASILESVPPDDRLLVWGQLQPAQAGPALVEVSVPVRDALIENTPAERLFPILSELDADDLRYLSASLPESIRAELASALDAHDDRGSSRASRSRRARPRALMTQESAEPEGTQTAGEAVAGVRQLGSLPTHTDRLFVVDPRKVLVGAVPLGTLLVADPGTRLPRSGTGASAGSISNDPAEEPVATAFERYDLLSAPVVDDRGKLIGRVTADSVMDFTVTSSEKPCARPRRASLTS